MHPQPQPRVPLQPTDLRFLLLLPVTRMDYGPFSFDPLEKLIGQPVERVLSSLMTGPRTRRPGQGGAPAAEVYPLRLPVGEGASVPLGALGELGFFNERGLLKLTVPAQAGTWLAERLGDARVAGPTDGVGMDRRSRVKHVWVRLKPGFKAGMPVAGFGEVGVEVA